MTALLRGCLNAQWKGDKLRSDQLDSRWGDTAISAPTIGGWSQLSSDSPAGGNDAGSVRGDEKGLSLKRFNSTKAVSPRIVGLGLSNVTSKKDTATPDDVPVFVYKPASEDFLRDMAALGNPQPQPEEYDYSSTSYNPRLIIYKSEGDDLMRELAEANHISSPQIPPTEIRDMPHHPSYRTTIRSPSPSLSSQHSIRSTGGRGRRNAIHPPSPSLSLPISPRISPRPEFAPISYGDLPTNNRAVSSPVVTKRKVHQPTINPRAEKRNIHKRTVTEEMVPSYTELFG